MTQTVVPHRLFGAALVLAALVALVFSYSAPGSAQGNPYHITLYGENEVPPVFTSATGSANIQVTPGELHFSVTAEGASFTMGHIHYGPAGTNGPVAVWLFDAMDDPIETVNVSGSVSEADLVGPFEGDWDGFLRALAVGDLYVNVHSEANPAGELRAQIYPRWGAALNPEEETHDVDSDASGDFHMDVDSASATYTLTGGGGTEAFTMGHIHVGAAGTDGPVVVWLFNAMDAPLSAVSIQGDTFTPANLEDEWTGDWDAFLGALTAGNFYVNVHSEEFPAGEMRGQLSHTANRDAGPADVEEPTPTATPTVVPTEVPTATPTGVPAATATPTATPTLVAPGPPATGTGDGGSGGMLAVLGFAGVAVLVIGGALAFGVRRKLA